MQIVVASSNIFRRELSVYVVGEAGYQVSEARDSAGLIAAIQTCAPDLLIIDDVLLSDVESPELLRRIRAVSSAPILWLAQGGREAAAHLMVASPPSDILPWPYNPDELIRRIDRLVVRHSPVIIPLAPPLHQNIADAQE